MAAIADNLAVIAQRMKKAALASGRDPGPINLIVVSKGHSESAVREALAAGHRCFGENRVQEAKAKYAGLRGKHPELKLHLIGPLQTNKAEEAVRLFDVIESLDRLRLADSLAKAIVKTRLKPDLYVEINIASEPQKTGIDPATLDDFLTYCRVACGLNITGLMCIPPQGKDAKPYFLRLKEMADRHKLPNISMGMSADFEEAIRCGATEVRIGSAIFGERTKTL